MHNLALEAAVSDSNLLQEAVLEQDNQRDAVTDIIQLTTLITVIRALYFLNRWTVTDTQIICLKQSAESVLGDLSGLLGSIPCNKCLFSTAEQQEDAPMMSKKSTNDRVVPNCWHTPLQWLSGWEVEGGEKRHSHRKTHSFLKQGCFFPLHVNLNP